MGAGGALAAGAVSLPVGSAHAAGRASATAGANPYSPAYRHAYRKGVVPTIGRLAQMKSWAASHLGLGGLPVNFGSETLSYGGGIDGIGVTSGTPKVYLVFWGTQWGTQGTDSNGNLTFSADPDSGAPYIQNLFKGLGTGG